MKKATAIRRAGGATNLAQMLGLTRQAVHQWGEDIPPLQVYRLRELRPSWFSLTKKSEAKLTADFAKHGGIKND